MNLRPNALSALLVSAMFIAVSPAPTFARSGATADVPRNSSGRIHRSSTARTEFKKANPCPATGSGSGACPGYVIDHVQPLKRGGPDTPANMQWQTKADAKAKDKWE